MSQLMRDNTPRIVKERKGEDIPASPLDDEKYHKELLATLDEGVHDIKSANTPQTMQSGCIIVYDAIFALLKLQGIEGHQFMRAWEDNRNEWGGFDKKLGPPQAESPRPGRTGYYVLSK